MHHCKGGRAPLHLEREGPDAEALGRAANAGPQGQEDGRGCQRAALVREPFVEHATYRVTSSFIMQPVSSHTFFATHGGIYFLILAHAVSVCACAENDTVR